MSIQYWFQGKRRHNEKNENVPAESQSRYGGARILGSLIWLLANTTKSPFSDNIVRSNVERPHDETPLSDLICRLLTKAALNRVTGIGHG